MGLSIIIRDKRSEKERTIQERAQAILAHSYKRECKGDQFNLPGKPTKADFLKAWSDDAKGDIDPAL